MEWVNSEALKSAYGGQLAVFCNRHGEIACMHFMKDFKCIRNFYCSKEIFLINSKTGAEIEMFDECNNRLRVRPFGFHNFKSYFNVDDLISAGVLLNEISRLCKNK